MYKYALREKGVSIEKKLGKGTGGKRDLTTKDTKEHKGEFEAWLAAGELASLASWGRRFSAGIAFVSLGALCG
jgi:hypothetical protein